MRRNIGILLMIGLFGTALVGCSSNPFSFDRPPVSDAARAKARNSNATRTVVAVGTFDNPTRAHLRWRDIGSGMSDALARSLLNEGAYDVWIDPAIGDSLLRALDAKPERRAAELEKLRRLYPNVDFVVTGKVTDFHHTTELPPEYSRWGMFGRKGEAIVAIDWNIFDMHRQRVVAAQHVFGTSSADADSPPKVLYDDVGFGSYLFWSTPLGRASRVSLDKTIAQMHAVLPDQVGDPTIIRMVTERKLAVEGGWSWGIVEGQQYYLLAETDPTMGPQVVFDPDTENPLVVQIIKVERDSSTAWMLGRKPKTVDLRGAVLTREPPVASVRPTIPDRSTATVADAQ